jgi:hypothetical protein
LPLGWRRRRPGAPAGGGGGAVHRLEVWRRGGGATSGGGGEATRHLKGCMALFARNCKPKTTRAKPQRRQPPALKRFRGVRGEFGRHGNA